MAHRPRRAPVTSVKRVLITTAVAASTVLGLHSTVWAQYAPHLVHVAHVPGILLDVDATRVAYLEAGTIKVRDRVSCTVTTLGPSATRPDAFSLSSTGASWSTGYSIGGAYTAQQLRAVNGDWAVWQTPDPANQHPSTHFVNLATGVVSVVMPTETVSLYGAPSTSLDVHGNYAYSALDGTHGHHVRAASVAAGDHAGASSSSTGLVDGTTFVTTQYSGLSPYRLPIVLTTPTATEVLDGTTGNVGAPMQGSSPIPVFDYQAHDGWVAYDKGLTSDQLALWTRSPAGVTAQATPHVGGQLVALSSTGEIAYRYNGYHYVGAAGAAGPRTPIAIADLAPPATPLVLGRGARYLSGAWHELAESDLYRFDPTVDSDGTGPASECDPDGGVGASPDGSPMNSGAPPSAGPAPTIPIPAEAPAAPAAASSCSSSATRPLSSLSMFAVALLAAVFAWRRAKVRRAR
jgi:hypothetical protein